MDRWTGNNNTCDRSNVSVDAATVTQLHKTWANIWKLSENTTKHIGNSQDFAPLKNSKK